MRHDTQGILLGLSKLTRPVMGMTTAIEAL